MRLIGAPNFADWPARRRSHWPRSPVPADAGATDEGDGRVRAVADGLERPADAAVVMHRLVDGVAGGQEFLEIAAGGKGLITLTAHDHAAHRIVGGKRAWWLRVAATCRDRRR